MASPQVETGHLKIADELVNALHKLKFSAVEYRVILAVMSMTYRVGKTKAAVSMDDLRYATDEKRYTLEKAIATLLDAHVLFMQQANETTILGIQKDFEKWQIPPRVQKIGNILRKEVNTNTTNTLRSTLQNFGNVGTTPPDKLLVQIHTELNVPYQKGRWFKERKSALELYKQALDTYHEPEEAVYAILDLFHYLDNPDFRARVSLPLTYMLGSFKGWAKQIPKKPKSIVEDEAFLGYHFRYNLKTKRWETSDQKLKPRRADESPNG